MVPGIVDGGHSRKAGLERPTAGVVLGSGHPREAGVERPTGGVVLGCGHPREAGLEWPIGVVLRVWRCPNCHAVMGVMGGLE